jgi:hypothetical protein
MLCWAQSPTRYRGVVLTVPKLDQSQHSLDTVSTGSGSDRVDDQHENLSFGHTRC